MSVATKSTLTVTGRVVNQKRHTIGYFISGTAVSRAEAVRLANRGWVDNVAVAKANGKQYIVGKNRSLYDLPIRVGF